MSDDTRDKMEEAIRAHYQSELPGGLMTDYYLVIAGVPNSSEPSTQYVFDASDSAIHSIIGLARMGMMHIESIEEEHDE